jgi:hypothetical protein
MGKLVLPGRGAAGLWIPNRRLVRAEMEVGLRIEGWVTTELRDANTGALVQRLRFRNLFTDAGLNFFGSNNYSSGVNPTVYFTTVGFIAAGTGTTAPANSDVALVNEFLPTSAQRCNTDTLGTSAIAYVAGPPDYHRARAARRFSTAQVNGTIGELGFFSAATGGTLFARCLPKDANGNVTTITKTSAQTLDIVWEFRWYPAAGDVSSSVVVSGTTYTMTYRPCNVSVNVTSAAFGWGSIAACGPAFVASGALGAWKLERYAAIVTRTSTPASATNIAASTAAQSYNDASYYREVVLSSAGGSAAVMSLDNAWSDTGGSGSTRAAFQFGFSPSFPSGVPIVFRMSWARYP